MSAVVPQRGMLRLLLLAAVAVGVTGMHTLGHPSSDHPPMKTMHATAAHAGDMPAAGGHAPAAADAVVPVGVAVMLTPATGGGMGMDPMTVCMAIMTGLGLVLLVVLMLFPGRRAAGDRRGGPQWTTAVGRAPPRSVLAGLRLADLSVLRI